MHAYRIQTSGSMGRPTPRGPVEAANSWVPCTLEGEGDGTIDPWPFALPRLVGLVTSSATTGYPEQLAPVVVPYDVRQTRTSPRRVRCHS
jgi:hypothetical protein